MRLTHRMISIHLYTLPSELFTDDNLAWDLFHTYTYIRRAHYMHAIRGKDWIEERWIECRSFQVVISSTTYTIWNEYEWVPNKMLIYSHVHSQKPLLCVYMSSGIVPAAAVFLLLLRFLSPKALLDERKAIKWLTRAYYYRTTLVHC